MTARITLEQELQELKQSVKEMARIAIENLKEGLIAFKQNDFDKAKQVMKNDELVDNLEENIAKQAIKIIWKEQPVAKDLRFVTGILKLITDIERIGDHASDIAEMTLHLTQTRNNRVMPITTQMAEIIESMVLKSIDALITLDEHLARTVINEDDQVDELFSRLIYKITEELKKDEIDPNEAIYVMMVAKYFERVGDHAVNIAEWIIFITNGTHKNNQIF
ncbi:MAG: phosphate signaling complex protein PhoU [Paracholeplasma sp.]|nr:phosphate signaling complex protein PhoU [Paracholeplasma sp.]MDY3196389.1 phosphate signaling complex protein PhoU [Paracholeplasma sp.]